MPADVRSSALSELLLNLACIKNQVLETDATTSKVLKYLAVAFPDSETLLGKVESLKKLTLICHVRFGLDENVC
jgi:hypothetical protein